MNATAKTGLLIAAVIAATWFAATANKARPIAADRPVRDYTKPSGPAHVEATLPLPGGAGQAHVIAVPSEFGEVMRCVVGTTASGAISTSCAPKSIEAIATDP